MKPLKLIRASAGSGKTFSLTAHYLILLFSGVGKYREILAVTFTNKATAEMKERILGALTELADPAVIKPSFFPILKEHYPNLGDEEIRLKAASIYRSILHDYSRFSVSTIDGFVQEVIRSFAFELNLDSGYKLEMNEEKVKDELVKSLNLQLEKDPELLQWVTGLAVDRINEARDWNYQRALKELAAEIFKERYYPFQEAMLAMGNERSREFANLKNEITRGIGEFKEVIITTARKAKQVFDQSGVSADDLPGKSRHPVFTLNKVIEEDFAKINRYKLLIGDASLWHNKTSKNPAISESLFTAISPVLNELVEIYETGIRRYETYRAINKNSPYLRLMQEMADLLKNYRSENRALLISDAQQLLKGITGSDVDNPSFVWEKTGNRYKHFLFDEFQDTSSFQWMNFLPLVKNAIAESRGIHADHLIVGDVKQSIYRWRNGDWRILHTQAKVDLGKENSSEHTLEFNRRSCENIIRFNNFLYGTLPGILQTHINTKIDETGRPDIRQFWDKEYNSIILDSYRDCQQKLTDTTLPGGKIEIDLLPKGEDEEGGNVALSLQYLADKLKVLLGEGLCAMKDICILVRKNSEAEDVIHYLVQQQAELSEAAGKTFQVISGEALKIKNSKPVQLLLNTMNMLAAREDENGIFKAVCARLANELAVSADIITLDANAWVRLGREPVEQLGDFLPEILCREYRSFKQLPIAELTEKLIQLYALGTEERASEIPFLLAFRDQVAVFASGGDQGLPAFLEWWEAEGSKKALPSAENQDAVAIMTVHKSKGLEYKAVLVPFCDWNLNTYSNAFRQKLLWVNTAGTRFDNFAVLPVDYAASLGATDFAESYFEEMLLSYMDTLNTLYVATTRAREYLYLVSPQKKKSEYHLYDILSQVLKEGNEYQTEFILQENRLSYGEFLPGKENKEDNSSAYLNIHRYPLNDSFSANFSTRHLPSNAWFNDQQRKGTMLHELLAGIDNSSELESKLSQYIQEGNVRESEKQEFYEALSAILSHQTIAGWFSTADKIISERDILSGNGRSERPDKVFVIGDHLVLLDFKFGEHNPSYNRQLHHYSDLLLGMGLYKSVEAYIWYHKTKTLQAV